MEVVDAPHQPGPEPGQPTSVHQRTPGFEELFEDHHQSLLAMATLLCGDRYQAEDTVAEVFARAYRVHERSPIRQPKAYLRRAVVNETRSGWRKKGVRRRYVEQRRREREPPPMEERVTEFDRLSDALAQLNERQRSAIVLRFYDDLSEKATAEALGVPVGKVKSSVARGLAKLEEILGDE
jgi:RNA polymerase sigma-70 factor (sigma-E family)